jgi:tetratricopeptide (TPR) repeat protein
VKTFHCVIVLMSGIIGVACGRAPESQRSPAAASSSSPPPAAAAARLVTGLGQHHHPISTSNPQAQQFFDQGFSLVFAFNHEEAVRSFQQAAVLDPQAAMPHWGIAWALGPNYNLDIDDPRAKQASEAMKTAEALGAKASEPERDYIAAMAIRYSPDPKADRSALARRYSQAMGGLTRKYPDDLDAATLYAESLMNLRPWKLWTLDGKPAEDTETIVGILESVLKRDPNHLGANHSYIHTVEASPTPERALPSAERLKTMAPAAGHLVHMPAHILARTGDQAGAAAANVAGVEADRAYLKQAPPDSFYGMMYYSHNLQFLADSEMMQGRFADAQRAATEVSERLLPHVDMAPMIESVAVEPVSVLLRFGRDADVLMLPAPPMDKPVMIAWWHFARGVALARTHQADAAAGERAELASATAKVPESALFGGFESARTILELAQRVLDARISWARGNRDQAIGLWKAAVTAGDRLSYDEPPAWFYPLRESLGAALLLAGRAADAEQVFRDDLVRHPRNARSLFGLRESLEKQGKSADAAWVDRAFEDAWKNADSKLTLDGL